ncbi:hypothetical protein Lser_V15G05909 [Lactuca serriola]
MGELASNLQGSSMQEVLAQVLQKKKETKLSSLARDLGFQLLFDDIDITMPVTNVQPDDDKLEELVVREVYQAFKEYDLNNTVLKLPMIYMMDCIENDYSSLLKSSTKRGIFTHLYCYIQQKGRKPVAYAFYIEAGADILNVHCVLLGAGLFGEKSASSSADGIKNQGEGNEKIPYDEFSGLHGIDEFAPLNESDLLEAKKMRSSDEVPVVLRSSSCLSLPYTISLLLLETSFCHLKDYVWSSL